MYQQIGILEKDKQALSLGEINKWIELTTRASNQKDICCGRNDSALKYAISFFTAYRWAACGRVVALICANQQSNR